MSEVYQITLKVNDQTIETEVAPGKTLLEFLRDDLHLTGTKQGCGKGDCGTCTVLMDGEPVKSGVVFAVQAEGHHITTIEGIAPAAGERHPVQQGLRIEGGVQCGFCTPGVVLSGASLLARNPSPTAEQIRCALEGNLCRCTGYQKIIRSIQRASQLNRRS